MSLKPCPECACPNIVRLNSQGERGESIVCTSCAFTALSEDDWNNADTELMRAIMEVSTKGNGDGI